jgi:hypothetical protein
MPLTHLEQDSVVRGAQAAKLVIEDLKPLLDRLNILYDSQDGLHTTITDEGLEEIPSLSGLTKQQLDDGMYALTSTLRSAINNAYTALVELAARA